MGTRCHAVLVGSLSLLDFVASLPLLAEREKPRLHLLIRGGDTPVFAYVGLLPLTHQPGVVHDAHLQQPDTAGVTESS